MSFTPTPEQLRVGYFYHSVLELAVKMEITLTKEEREELISLLLKTAAQEPEETPSLYLQATVNYLRAISDV